MNRFEKLAAIDCSKKTEKKNGLTYLSWAWAWDQLKRVFPDSYYTIYEGVGGCMYHTDGRTCWVKTGVTLVDGDFHLEHIEYLPVMDYKNRSIPLEQITSMDANKAIQRSLTKAVARFGLGLYIYAGEDLPMEEQSSSTAPVVVEQAKEPESEHKLLCTACGKAITAARYRDRILTPAEIAERSMSRYGKVLCCACAAEQKKAAVNG